MASDAAPSGLSPELQEAYDVEEHSVGIASYYLIRAAAFVPAAGAALLLAGNATNGTVPVFNGVAHMAATLLSIHLVGWWIITRTAKAWIAWKYCHLGNASGAVEEAAAQVRILRIERSMYAIILAVAAVSLIWVIWGDSVRLWFPVA
jgi:hypothetical protein